MAKPQPAKVSYFFGKGYTDLWNTIKESWSRNIHSAGDQFSLACEKGCFTMGGGMNLIAAISIFTFGSAITAFTTFAHIAVLFAFFAFIYIGFGLLWLIDRIYIMINKIKNDGYIVKMLDAHIAMRKDYALYLRIYADTFLNKAISPSDYQYERNESLSDDELLYYNEIQEILKSINAQMSKHEIDHCKGIVI